MRSKHEEPHGELGALTPVDRARGLGCRRGRDGRERWAQSARSRWSRVLGAHGAVAIALLAAALGAASARADAPVLEVTDLGQPAVPVISGQPPVSASVWGTCAEPFTLQASCPPGSWPGLGSNWGMAVAIAGGDTLALTFAAPMTTVSVAATSNYPPGVTTPGGQPISNYDVLAQTAAMATPDPKTWQVALPALDVRAMSGYTFSVVASDTAGPHDYALTIRSPRFEDELSRCGTAYYSTALSQYLCAGDALPPGMPGRAVGAGEHSSRDARRSLTISSPATFTHGRLRLRLTVPRPGTLRVKLTIPRRAARTIVRRVRVAGRVQVVAVVPGYRPSSTSRLTVVASLRASGHNFKAARRVAVTRAAT